MLALKEELVRAGSLVEESLPLLLQEGAGGGERGREGEKHLPMAPHAGRSCANQRAARHPRANKRTKSGGDAPSVGFRTWDSRGRTVRRETKGRQSPHVSPCNSDDEEEGVDGDGDGDGDGEGEWCDDADGKGEDASYSYYGLGILG